MRRTIRLKESELRRMISESVKRILNEIGDKNDFALDAVRGRRAAKQYYTNMNDTEKAENNRVMGLAQDKIYKNYSKNHNLGVGNGPGYYYGFKKGLDKYANGDVSESHIKRTLRENIEDWYAEEDYNGQTGEEGEVKSYDIGSYYLGNAERDAEENGYDDVAEWLKNWFFEIQVDCPWYWQKMGSGYGYNGDTIFEENGVVCKDIYGQLMFDEYPPQSLKE